MRSSPLHRFDTMSAEDIPAYDSESHREKIARIFYLTQNIYEENDMIGIIDNKTIEQSIAVYKFVIEICSNPAMERNLIYNQISKCIFNDVVYPSSWKNLGVTIFMMGAYLSHHHYSQFPNETNANTIVAWYFTDFCNRTNNDRFLTNDQLGCLCGPSEYDDVILILRLLWLSPRNFTRKYDITRQSDRFDAGEEFVSSDYFPISTLLMRHFLRYPPAVAAAAPDRPELPDTALPRNLELGNLVDFTHGGNARRYLVKDAWYWPETTLTWAKDHVGLFSFNLNDDTISKYILDIDIYVTEFHVNSGRNLRITFNGQTIHDLNLDKPDANRIFVPFGVAVNKKTALNTIGFHCAPITPSDFFGEDNRKIGVAVRRLWLREDTSGHRVADRQPADEEEVVEPH